MRPILETFVVGPFQENTYLLGDVAAGVAIAVDPGGRVEDLLRVAEHRGVAIQAIVNTHSHIDHVAGVAELKAHTGAPFLLHAEAAPMLSSLPEQAVRFGLPPLEAPEVDGWLVAGQVLEVGGLRLTVRFTPGHAPGHVTLVSQPLDLHGRTAVRALVGDVIFLGSIGRVDLPGGDYGTLMNSITAEILTLPEDAVLYSGHGPDTTVAHERAFNPFVRDWLAAAPEDGP